MVNQTTIIKTDAMPSQTVTALKAGSTSPGNSAIILQKQQIDAQMALIGKSGGGRFRRRPYKRKFIKGGAAEILVPATPPGASQASAQNYKQLTILANEQQRAAVFDTAKTPADTAKIQQATKGGSKKYRGKWGGSHSKWGCLSGGFTRRGIYRLHSSKTKKNKTKKHKSMKNKRKW